MERKKTIKIIASLAFLALLGGACGPHNLEGSMHNVVGGKVDTNSKYPNTVHVKGINLATNGPPILQKCSGVLVDTKHVITAVHCVCTQNNCAGRAIVYFVDGGKSYENASASISGKVIPYYKYKLNGTFDNHSGDLAIIRLDTIAPAKYQKPESLNSTPQLKAGDSVTFVGFGIEEIKYTKEEKEKENIQDCASVRTPEDRKKRKYGTNTISEVQTEYLKIIVDKDPTNITSTKDLPAPGDSGGPVYSSAGQLIGIVKGGKCGVTDSNPFGQSYFTKIFNANYSFWINKVTTEFCKNKNGTFCDGKKTIICKNGILVDIPNCSYCQKCEGNASIGAKRCSSTGGIEVCKILLGKCPKWWSDIRCQNGCLDSNPPGSAKCKNCQPNCTNKSCGDDSCGGKCGTCATGEICSSQGACVPFCSNLCINRKQRICNNATEYKVCDDHNKDSCLEWKNFSCSKGHRCLSIGCFACLKEARQNPQASPPAAIKAGETKEIEIVFTNKSDFAWVKSTQGVSNQQHIELWTCDANGNIVDSSFAHSSWINTRRIGSLALQTIVNPGDNARFIFKIKAPSTPGQKRLYVIPVIGGVPYPSACFDQAYFSFDIKPAPTITFTTPKQGDVMEKGKNYTITWTSSQVQAPLRIVPVKGGKEIPKNPSANWVITTTGQTSGSVAFFPVSSWPDGNDYQICGTAQGGSISGCSGRFSIVFKACICTANQTRCNDKALERCQSDCQKWIVVQQCPGLCQNGLCTSCPCQTGAKRCNGGNVEQCSNCQWNVMESCNSKGQVCLNQSCCKPTTEACDGRDNDCDGKVDEDFGDVGKACSSGVGACNRAGRYMCKSDGSGIVCDAQPGSPSPEACDGIDNDCNGFVDDKVSGTGGTCSTGKLGVCNAGTFVCANGSRSCKQTNSPTGETCDGKDNNCDGQTDEGQLCTAGQSCQNGACIQLCSPPSLTRCQGNCVDTKSNNLHCGGCSRRCSVGYTCQNGRCLCPPGTQLCGTTCVNVSSNNPNHCGGCNLQCNSDQSCQSGKCTCNNGGITCGGTCILPNSDKNHCGKCYNKCSMGMYCSNGKCVCPSGLTPCSGSCVDLNTSTYNCGSCGNRCSTNEKCTNGKCGCKSSTLCGVGKYCDKGACKPMTHLRRWHCNWSFPQNTDWEHIYSPTQPTVRNSSNQTCPGSGFQSDGREIWVYPLSIGTGSRATIDGLYPVYCLYHCREVSTTKSYFITDKVIEYYNLTRQGHTCTAIGYVIESSSVATSLKGKTIYRHEISSRSTNMWSSDPKDGDGLGLSVTHSQAKWWAPYAKP